MVAKMFRHLSYQLSNTFHEIDGEILRFVAAGVNLSLEAFYAWLILDLLASERVSNEVHAVKQSQGSIGMYSP